MPPFAHADLIVQDVNAVQMVAEELVEPVQQEEHVLVLEGANATEIVLERNVEMMDATLEMSATTVVLVKFVVLTSDVPEPAHQTAEILMELKESVVMMDVLDLVASVPQFRDKTFDAEMGNASADLNVIISNVVLMDVAETVEPALVMLHASTVLVSILFLDVVEMVFAKLL